MLPNKPPDAGAVVVDCELAGADEAGAPKLKLGVDMIEIV